MAKDKTVELLNAIAARLASRTDCRRVEYELKLDISDKNELTYEFKPDIWVYPNPRSKLDRWPIVDYILMTKFRIEFDLMTKNGVNHMKLATAAFVPGVYKYQLSVTKKHRKWVKLL